VRPAKSGTPKPGGGAAVSDGDTTLFDLDRTLHEYKTQRIKQTTQMWPLNPRAPVAPGKAEPPARPRRRRLAALVVVVATSAATLAFFISTGTGSRSEVVARRSSDVVMQRLQPDAALAAEATSPFSPPADSSRPAETVLYKTDNIAAHLVLRKDRDVEVGPGGETRKRREPGAPPARTALEISAGVRAAAIPETCRCSACGTVHVPSRERPRPDGCRCAECGIPHEPAPR
jgi:hypothetical protein